jgi:hypothetical protein
MHPLPSSKRNIVLKHSLALFTGLAALSVGVASPAMAQMKTSKPAAPKVAAPEATPSVGVAAPATPSVATSLPVQAAPAPSGGGFSWPKSPVPITLGANFDFGGGLNTGGFEMLSVSGGGATTQVPGLGSAKPDASGNGFTAEIGLPLVTLGARMQNYSFAANPAATFNDPTVPSGATVTKPATLGAFFPTDYQEVYAKLFGLSLGYRNETYGGTGNYAGTYGNLMLGVPILGFNLLDTLGVGVGLKGGYSLSKPDTLKNTDIIHVPVEGDANVSFKLAMLKAKLGYKAAAVVNAAPGDLLSALTNPGSLVPTNGTIDQKKLDNLTATRYGLYTGPYLGIELGF